MRRVTIRDVAAEAGVSIGTASKALNGQGKLRTETRERVAEVAQRLGFAPVYGSENPFSFMELQGVQELTNFFERRPSAYQVAVEGSVGFDEDF